MHGGRDGNPVTPLKIADSNEYMLATTWFTSDVSETVLVNATFL